MAYEVNRMKMFQSPGKTGSELPKAEAGFRNKDFESEVQRKIPWVMERFHGVMGRFPGVIGRFLGVIGTFLG